MWTANGMLEEKTVHKKHLSSAEKAEKIAFVKKQEFKKKKKEGVEPMPKWKKKILKKYLKKHGLPRGGSGQDLKLRVELHQKQSKKVRIKKVWITVHRGKGGSQGVSRDEEISLRQLPLRKRIFYMITIK